MWIAITYGHERYRMQESNNLKIRINFNSSKKSVAKQTIDYHYNWRRIAVVSFAVIATSSLIIKGIYSLNSQEAVTRDSSLINSVKTSERPNHHAQDKNSAQPATTFTAKRAILPAMQRQQPVTVTETSAAVINPITKKITPSGNNRTTKPTDKLFSKLKTEIFATQINRFTLAKGINNREPIGSINDVKFKNELATIYAYADIHDLQDQTIYYHWSFNGKPVAKVKVAVLGDRWRSYSTKFIQAHMHGLWQVALRNSKGETLAIQQFTY
ncbi:DUF2914 domain-containing protein [Psychromonas sp. MME2]|uniref:DUF2914 domain-containing protein n=1 Tax=unclassified Psychromonas TaxID=2614957 RepID=UPI00339BD1B6